MIPRRAVIGKPYCCNFASLF